MRCLALAQAWIAEGGRATFLGCCENAALRRRVTDEGARFIPLPMAHPNPTDWQTISRLIRKLKPDWLVIDGYHFDPEYQKAARADGVRVLVIDDTAHWPRYHADILLNQNLGAEKLQYHCDHDTRLLLGTRYVMLRAEFERWRGWRRRIPRVATRILVTMGGADPQNIVAKAVLALQYASLTGMEVRVLLGPDYQYERRLRRDVRKQRLAIALLRRVADVSEHMAWADFAVAAGGSTCWEMARMGLPAATLAAAENQKQVACLMARRGITAYLGEAEATTVAQMARAVGKLAHDQTRRRAMSHAGRGLVDGMGAHRVVSSMNRPLLRRCR